MYKEMRHSMEINMENIVNAEYGANLMPDKEDKGMVPIIQAEYGIN